MINEHSDSGHDDEHNNEDNPSQQAALSNTILIDTNRLRLINRLIPPKWFSKVKLLFAMSVNSMLLPWRPMIDSRANMNCIQEGIIPSIYYEKSTEKLFFANGI